ncbi:ABC transporter, permease protein [Geomicrobium sp. JCM 19039]|nr:ABC transporter, permease protein [Geomicrobium sp. JCM 19039]
MSYFDDAPEERSFAVGVVDETESLAQSMRDVLDLQETNIQIFDVELGEESPTLDDIEDAGYDAFLELHWDEPSEELTASYYAASVNSTYLPAQLESTLQSIIEERRMEALDISREELEAIYADVELTQTALDDTSRSEAELDQARFFVYILLFVIYFTVLFLGNMIASEVAAEKSSRVMEILISSVTPIQQMFGKILGVGLVGLSQYAILFMAMLLTASADLLFNGAPSDLPSEPLNVPEFTSDTLFSFDLFLLALLFFVLGYFLYATLAAMLGSVVTRVEDVGLAVGPLNFLVILALLISMFSLSNPSATIAVVTSYIPFFTPMIMFLRVGMGEAGMWELIVSVVIMVATIVLLAMFAAKVYRGGVLQYSQGKLIQMFKNAIQNSKSN